jgi:hypothetical protein
MALVRSWLIRAVLLAGLAGLGGVGWVFHHRVSPEQVRAAVLAHLRGRFPDAEVHVGAAGYRLFGGITVHDLRVSRPGDARPLFAAPTAVIVPDKEGLGRGRIALKKVELDRPTLRLDRRPDGTWGLPGLAGSPDPTAPLPTLLATNATLLLTDGRPNGLPPLAVLAPRVTVVNDPAHTLRFDGQFTMSPAADDKPAEGGLAIPLTVAGRVHRQTLAGSVRIEIPDLAVTPDLAPAAARLDPQLADVLSQVSARVGLKADLATTGDPARPVKADVRLDVRDGRFDDPSLPWPAEQVSASVRIADGKLTVEKGTARLGKAVATFRCESRPAADPAPPVGGPKRYAPARLIPVPACNDPLSDAESRLERYEIELRGLTLDDDLFAKLPPRGQKARALFGPTGGIDLKVRFHRPAGGWTREFVVVPRGLGVVYAKFKYPVTDIAGEIKRVADHTGTDEFRVQVSGTAGGRRIRCDGRVGADGPDPLIELRLTGNDVPIDPALFAALPPKFAAILADLQAAGRGDFTADIRQPQDVNKCDNSIRVKVYGGRVNYKHFPYPLATVKGEIDIQVSAVDADRPVLPGGPVEPVPDTDRVTFRRFEAVHGGGTVLLSGESEPVPGTVNRRLRLEVKADKLPLDADLRAAVGRAQADRAWAALNPRGVVTFGAEVEVLDRGGAAPQPPVVPAGLPGGPGFDPLRDLSLTVNFVGPTVTPGGLGYDLADFAGVVQYKGGEVRLSNLSAGHGASRFRVADGKVILAAGGRLFADLRGLSVKPLVVDADLRAALPDGVRAGLDAVNPRGPVELRVVQLVLDTAGGAPVPDVVTARGQAGDPAPTVYWNGEVKLLGTSLAAGLDWDDAVGVVASVGKLDAGRLQAVVGNAWLDRVSVHGQPLTQVRARFQVRPPAPGAAPAVEFPDLRAVVHGGFVGGTGRVSFDSPPRYRFDLLAGDIRLEQLARTVPIGPDVRGVFQGTFAVECRPDPLTGKPTPTGKGQFDILDARLYNMPVLMPLLKLMKLQTPDQTAFDEAHATVVLAGDTLTVPQLDLIGTALSLGGSGEADVRGGDARFEFYTVWSQSLRRWLTTPFGDVSSFLSGNLFRIDLVRKDGRTTYQPHMLPAVTDPVRAVAQRLRDRVGGQPTARAAGPR